MSRGGSLEGEGGEREGGTESERERRRAIEREREEEGERDGNEREGERPRSEERRSLALTLLVMTRGAPLCGVGAHASRGAVIGGRAPLRIRLGVPGASNAERLFRRLSLAMVQKIRVQT